MQVYCTKNKTAYVHIKTTTKNMATKSADKTLSKYNSKCASYALVVAAILHAMVLSLQMSNVIVVIFIVEQRPCNAVLFYILSTALPFGCRRALIDLFINTSSCICCFYFCFYNFSRERNGVKIFVKKINI